MSMMVQSGRFAAAGGSPPLDGLSPTGAWSMSRDLLTSFIGGNRYTTVTGVNSLTDQTANAADFNQASTSLQPAVTTAGPNSRTCIDLDGSDDYLQCTKNLSTQITAGDAFIVISGLIDTITSDNGTIYNNQAFFADNAGYTGLVLRTTGSGVYAYNFDGNWDTTAVIALSTATAYVLTWRHNGGNIYVSVNGGAETSVASGNTGGGAGDLAEQYRIGKGLSANFDGKIFEMACWNSGSTPDATSRAAIIADFMTWIGAV